MVLSCRKYVWHQEEILWLELKLGESKGLCEQVFEVADGKQYFMLEGLDLSQEYFDGSAEKAMFQGGR